MSAQKIIDLSALRPAPTEDDAADVMARLIDEIAEDARVAPEAYLQETIVPEGGE